MAKHKTKNVKVYYGLLNNANESQIDKAITKWEKKGYRLESRQDNDVGCLPLLLTIGWARGHTVLMFRLDK